MNVIDVAILGGPDLAAVVERRQVDDGLVLAIEVLNGGLGPAHLEQVLVPIESPPIRSVTAHGWRHDEPGYAGAPTGGIEGPLVTCGHGTVGWLGAAHHRGLVSVQADGWLITATAEMAGMILAPGERVTLDPLFVGGALPSLLSAWRSALPPLREVPPVEGVIVAAGASGADLDRAGAAFDQNSAHMMLLASNVADVDAVAGAADAIGAAWGVAARPFGDPGHPLDLSRPDSLEQVRKVATRLAGVEPGWVVVAGAGATLDRPHWGGASATSVASLRNGLRTLREVLGPGPVLHVAGGPPTALAGLADVIDVGPGHPHADPVTPVVRRAGLHQVIWTASPGPLGPDVPPAMLSDLAAVSGPRLRWPPNRPPVR